MLAAGNDVELFLFTADLCYILRGDACNIVYVSRRFKAKRIKRKLAGNFRKISLNKKSNIIHSSSVKNYVHASDKSCWRQTIIGALNYCLSYSLN